MTAVLEPARTRVTEEIELKHPVTLLHGAVEDTLPLIPTASCDAVITDPPYALAMGGQTEGWDNYTPRQFAAFCEGWARECRRILKPGGWMISFGSGRTWHRMTVGLEDAGLDIIDSINWMYPSGFVRSVDIAARVEAAGFPERAAELAGRGTSLHSRHEPATLARAKLKGGLARTAGEYGTGTMDLESTSLPSGRTAPNVLVQHSPLCGGEEDGMPCVPGCPVLEFGANLEYFPTFRFEGKPSKDERPRVTVEAGQGTKKLTTLGQVRAWECTVCKVLTQSYMGSGSKYSNRPHPVCSHDSYVPLTDNFSATIAHNTVKPLGLMRWLIRLLSKPGDRILEPFAGSGSTIEAAVLEGREVVAVERDLSSIELCRVRLRRQGCFVEDA